MALRMARPVRLKTSRNIYFRQRIPADVLDKARGAAVVVPLSDDKSRIVIGGTASEVKFSLGTSDPRQAKSRHSAAADYLRLQGLQRRRVAFPRRA